GQELLALPVGSLFRADADDGLRRLRRACKEAGPASAREGFWLRHRTEGEWTSVNMSVTRFHAGPRVVGLITARDVSARKEAEEALRASEEKYRTLIENLEQCVFLKDAELRFVAANRPFCRSVG